MTLIDKETIRAEIERRMTECHEHIHDRARGYAWEAQFHAFRGILVFLDTLPEQPANDGLQEEIDKEIDKLDITPGYDRLAAFARHFAEWGAEHLKK